jgi:hypothetical protein
MENSHVSCTKDLNIFDRKALVKAKCRHSMRCFDNAMLIFEQQHSVASLLVGKT